MGSYATVSVGGIEVFSFDEEVPPTFMLLFRLDDVENREVPASQVWDLSDDEEGADELVQVTHLSCSAAALRDRLAVLGFGDVTVSRAHEENVNSMISRHEMARERDWGSDLLFELYDEEDRFLRGLTFDKWLASVAEAASHPREGSGRAEIGSFGWLLGLWGYVDARLLLAALVRAFPDEAVTIDVTELVEGGWLSTGFDPHIEAMDHFGWVVATGSPAIVLTEGRSDVRAIELAVAARRPHLEGFIRFTDFEAKPEGGAPALVRTAKALAAAGVANTVAVLFDNDTEGLRAAAELRSVALPAHFHILTYPPLELAANYPTVGPSGAAVLDVNGRAAAIEMYFGEDVLRGEDGELAKIRWTNHVPGANAYQGAFTNKAQLQQRFEEKAQRAIAGKTDGDWSGMDAILDLVVETISGPRRPLA